MKKIEKTEPARPDDEKKNEGRAANKHAAVIVLQDLADLLRRGKTGDALDLIKERHRLLEKTDLVRLMEIHRECLLKDGNYAEAMRLLSYYQELPYCSQEAEEMLKAWPEVIEARMREERPATGLSAPEMTKILTFSQDTSKIDRVLGLIMKDEREEDLRPALIALAERTDLRNQRLPALGLYLLASMHVRDELTVLTLNGPRRVRPSELKIPSAYEGYEAALRRLEEMTRPDQTVLCAAKTLLDRLLLFIYPHDPFKDDAKMLLQVLVQISKEAYRIETSPLKGKALDLKKLIVRILQDEPWPIRQDKKRLKQE